MSTKCTPLLFAIALAFFAINPALAQNKFKVLAVRGSVTTGTGKSLTLGQQLGVNERITVDKGAYVSLAHVNGKTIEVVKKGGYAVSDLDKKASSKTKSSTSKFASYVVSELTEVKEPVSFSEDKRTQMRTTGSVERAMGDEVSVWDSVLAVVGGPGELHALAAVEGGAMNQGTNLVIITPRHTRLLSDSVAFLWHRTPKSKNFTLVVKDRSRNTVYSTTTKDTMHMASIASMKLSAATLYYWHVEGTDDADFHSDEYALWNLSGEERQSAEQTIAEIRSDMSEEDGAIGQLILGAAFEDMGLYADAHASYAKAVRMAPDVQNYKRLYADFLRRQGLNLDAYVAYK